MSSARRKTATVSLDATGRPTFGSTVKQTPPPKQKGEEKQRKVAYTVAEHAAYLRSLGLPAWLVPGTPERMAMLKTFIQNFNGYDPIHYRQLHEWEAEVASYQGASL